MELQFIDSDFEAGMCFLVEVLADCIENQKYGWINEKRGNFAVNFVFNGLKKCRDVKRNSVVSSESLEIEYFIGKLIVDR